MSPSIKVDVLLCPHLIYTSYINIFTIILVVTFTCCIKNLYVTRDEARPSSVNYRSPVKPGGWEEGAKK